MRQAVDARARTVFFVIGAQHEGALAPIGRDETSCGL
jgi:hypothetical protein